MPAGWALAGAKADEREVLHDILAGTPGLAELIDQNRPTIVAGKGHYGKTFEADLADAGITLLRPKRAERNRDQASASSNHTSDHRIDQ